VWSSVIFLPGRKPSSIKLIFRGESEISLMMADRESGIFSAVMNMGRNPYTKVRLFGMNLKKNKQDFYQVFAAIVH
jgi:hypothetical protein